MRQRILATLTNSTSGVSAGNLASQYFVGSASPRGHSISNHSSLRRVLRFSSRCAARTRGAAKRDYTTPWLSSRQLTGPRRRSLRDSPTAFARTELPPAPRLHLFAGVRLPF